MMMKVPLIQWDAVSYYTVQSCYSRERAMDEQAIVMYFNS
jgi:hypothetical protein